MKKTALLIFPVIFLLSTCALEIANVIGPGGGYVFYDKGNYKNGWRYKECSPFDLGELKNTDNANLLRAVHLCIDQSDEWYAYDWEIPDEADLKKMLECFSYGLTRFSPDYYYLAVNGKYLKSIVKGDPVLDDNGNPVFAIGDPVLDANGDPVLDANGDPVFAKGEPVLYTENYKILDAEGYPVLDEGNRDKWETVILHKNFDSKANGEVERVDSVSEPNVIRVRPIRKF